MATRQVAGSHLIHKSGPAAVRPKLTSTERFPPSLCAFPTWFALAPRWAVAEGGWLCFAARGGPGVDVQGPSAASHLVRLSSSSFWPYPLLVPNMAGECTKRRFTS